MQEEAALHQHQHPSETTGTEHYRRIRNPDRSQIPGLYIHQNGSKVPVQSYRAVDTSTFRQNIREARSRPPENHSFRPPSDRDPGGIMHRMDNTEARYPGEQHMDRQHRPPVPPFAGRAPPHSHLQYSQRLSSPPAALRFTPDRQQMVLASLGLRPEEERADRAAAHQDCHGSPGRIRRAVDCHIRNATDASGGRGVGWLDRLDHPEDPLGEPRVPEHRRRLSAPGASADLVVCQDLADRNPKRNR
jgi:hypothetical protein